MNLSRVLYFLFFPIVFTCCGQRSDPPQVNTVADSRTDTLPVRDDTLVTRLPVDDTLDALANFLAGQQPGNTASLYGKDKTSPWQKYSIKVDSMWKKVDTVRLKKVEEWRNQELKPLDAMTEDIFYPFSGPDVLTILNLFPNSRNYYLMALEPVGTLPSLSTMKDSSLQKYLATLYTSYSDILHGSFFITANMKTDFNNEQINGVLPVLCIFLVKSNCRISGIEFLDKEHYTPLEKVSVIGAGNHPYKGAKISFFRPGDTALRTLTYLSVNLVDRGYLNNQPLRDLLDQMKNQVTYVKSASYLMHHNFFSKIREFILSKSQAIVQDDTGIPYAFFSSDTWDKQLYGSYVKPISVFKERFQPDLRHDYDSSGLVKPLPFKMGYGIRTNILRAVRK